MPVRLSLPLAFTLAQPLLSLETKHTIPLSSSVLEVWDRQSLQFLTATHPYPIPSMGQNGSKKKVKEGEVRASEAQLEQNQECVANFSGRRTPTWGLPWVSSKHNEGQQYTVNIWWLHAKALVPTNVLDTTQRSKRKERGGGMRRYANLLLVEAIWAIVPPPRLSLVEWVRERRETIWRLVDHLSWSHLGLVNQTRNKVVEEYLFVFSLVPCWNYYYLFDSKRS